MSEAGRCLIRSADSLPQDGAAQAGRATPHLRDAGASLVRAGSHWSDSWDAVTLSLREASESISSAASAFGGGVGEELEAAASEMEDASNIGGCTSIGPAAAAPNLIEIGLHFMSAADMMETGKGVWRMGVSMSMREAAMEFVELAEESS